MNQSAIFFMMPHSLAAVIMMQAKIKIATVPLPNALENIEELLVTCMRPNAASAIMLDTNVSIVIQR